jgi:glycosyltransferase involved in cell wall biosynthesis
MKVLSWHPVLTDHQSHTLAALQTAGKCTVKVFVADLEHAERRAQGWVNEHASLLSPQCIPAKGWIKFAIRNLLEHRDAVHLFSSPFERTRLILILLLAVFLGLKVYLISEPYSPISVGYQDDKRKFKSWLKAKLRPSLYKLYGFLIRQRIAGVFAISCLAVAQYRMVGIAREKIFPFGYFVPVQDEKCAVDMSVTDFGEPRLRLVFVGNLIERKGLDILLEGVREVNRNGLLLSVDVYGPGDPTPYDFDQSVVRYCGLIPFGNSQSVIANYDLLVLPSRYDGWGVVVNEALMAGVPVLCSNRVGASAVVEKWQCGLVFENENVDDLIEKLKNLLMNPDLIQRIRLATQAVSASLEPKVAGKYIFDIINKDSVLVGALKKQECPWYEC